MVMASQIFLSETYFSSRLGMLEDPFVNQTNNEKKSHKLRGTLKRKKRNVQCKKIVMNELKVPSI